MYDFWSNPRIKASSILAAHRDRAVERSECWDTVLAIQDTTELDYSGHRSKRGMGYLRGANTKGVLLHSVLSVSPIGTPVGIVHQQVWARTGRKTARSQRLNAQKESNRWIESLKATEAQIAPYRRILTIADREADLYELLACERRAGSEYLIRSYHDRQVKLTPSEKPQSLHQVMERLPIGGVVRLELQRTPRRSARSTWVDVRWASVWLQVPEAHRDWDRLAPIRVQVLWASEDEDQGDGPRVQWMLVTSMPIERFEQAHQLLTWYSYRWLIERYHYTLKSGCRVEALQLETFDRLERAIACYAIVAWRLLWLTYMARPLEPIDQGLEADWVLETEEWQALCQHYHAPPRSPDDPPRLSQCLLWIAQLGGFWGRKSDGEPGARTIWRGLRRLRDLVRQTVLPDAIAAARCV
jgi:hypothetical protein